MNAVDTGRVLLPERQPPPAEKHVVGGFGIESSSRKGRAVPALASRAADSGKESMGVLAIPSRRRVPVPHSKPETPFDRATAEQMRFYGGKDGTVPVIGVRDPGQCKPNLQGSVAVQSAIGGFDAPGSTPLPFGQSDSSSSSSSARPKSAKERRQWRQYLHNRSAGAADVIGVAKGAASRAQVPDGVDASSANGAGIESAEASARHSSRRTTGGAVRPGGKRQVQLQQSQAVWSILAEDAPPASRRPATASGSGSQGTRAPEEPRVKRGKGRRYAALLEGAQAASVTGIGPQIPEGKGSGNKPQEGPSADGAYLKGQPAKSGETAQLRAMEEQGASVAAPSSTHGVAHPRKDPGAAGLEDAARGRQARERGLPLAPPGRSFVTRGARPEAPRSHHYNQHLRSQHDPHGSAGAGGGSGSRPTAPWGTVAVRAQDRWRTASQDAMAGKKLSETAGSVHPRGGKAMVAGSSFGASGADKGGQRGLEASLRSGRRRIFSSVNNPYKTTSIY